MRIVNGCRKDETIGLFGERRKLIHRVIPKHTGIVRPAVAALDAVPYGLIAKLYDLALHPFRGKNPLHLLNCLHGGPVRMAAAVHKNNLHCNILLRTAWRYEDLS